MAESRNNPPALAPERLPHRPIRNEARKRAEKQRQTLLRFAIVFFLLALLPSDKAPSPAISQPTIEPPKITSHGDVTATLTQQPEPLAPSNSPENFLTLEKALHPEMKPERINEFLGIAQEIFPGPKISVNETLAIIYTEAAFGSMKPGKSGDLGPIQVIPQTKAEILEKVRKTATDPATKPKTANLFKAFSLSNNPASVERLADRFDTDVDAAMAIGILNLQKTANFTQAQIKLNNLQGLPENSILTLRAAGNNRFAAPMVLLADLANLKGKNPPTELSPASIDTVLGFWQQAGGKSYSTPAFQKGFFDSESIKNLRLYVRLDSYFLQTFDVVSNLAAKGKLTRLPNNFPQTLRSQLVKWIDEDYKNNRFSDISSPDRVTQLLQIIYPPQSSAKR